MRSMKYGIACVLVSMCAFYMHQHGEFHFAAATMTLGGGHHSPPLSCIDAADIGPVTDLVLLPAGGVLVASMSANASQPGRISLLPSTAFPPTAPSRAPDPNRSGFFTPSAQSLLPSLDFFESPLNLTRFSVIPQLTLSFYVYRHAAKIRIPS